MKHRIVVWQPVAVQAQASDGRLHSLASAAGKIELEPEALALELDALLMAFENVDREPKGAYQLSRIEVEVVVTASGKLAILGSGIAGGVTAGIKLIVSRAESSAPGSGGRS